VVAPRQFELRDWIKESDRQEQQIGAAANAMCWREIVDVEFEILQAAKRQAIAGQCILDIAQARICAGKNTSWTGLATRRNVSLACGWLR